MRTVLHHSHDQIDIDPFSTTILQQLLESNHEWKSIDQIIKLMFRAMVDVLNVHGQSIKDIKSVLTTRASKNEMMTGLGIKANINDVSKAIEDVSTAMERKVSYNDLNSMLKDYVNRADMIEVLVNKHETLQKKDDGNLAHQLTILKARMDDFQREVSKKVGLCASLGELEHLESQIKNKVNISEINQVLENKVSKQYLASALQKKITKSELDLAMSTKANVSDLESVIGNLELKVSLITLQKLTQVIQNKADRSQLAMLINQRITHNKSQQRQLQQQSNDKLQQIKNTFGQQYKDIRRQTQQLIRQCDFDKQALRKQFVAELKKTTNQLEIDNIRNISKLKLQLIEDTQSLKTQIKNFQQQLQFRQTNDTVMIELNKQIVHRKRSEQQLYEQVDDVRKRAQEISARGLQKNQFIVFKSQIMEQMESKIETEDVQIALNKFQSSINCHLAKDKDELLGLMNSMQKNLAEGVAIVGNDVNELKKSMVRKQEKYDNNLLEECLKKVRKQIEECRKTVDLVYGELTTKLSVREYETDLMEIKKRLQQLHKEDLLKAYIRDVEAIADSRPTIDAVNTTLRELNDALDQKINQSDFQAILKDQASINETLCSQNIVGRWLWQSGQLKAGGLIPWQIECTNTVPDHFFWEKDKTSILILAAGIYELTACVFNKSSCLSLSANGQQISSQLNRNQQNTNHVNTNVNTNHGATKKMQRRRKEKDVNGNMLREYVMLPARSRISLSCTPDVADGFLNIRRM